MASGAFFPNVLRAIGWLTKSNRRVGHPYRRSNQGAGPFALEGSGFRANFKRKHNGHTPPSMGLLFDS